MGWNLKGKEREGVGSIYMWNGITGKGKVVRGRGRGEERGRW